jgi:multidrug efflux pump subunit AcrA (membrane-fusion protein)
VEQLKNAILVPQASTVELQGSYFVKVLGPDNTVRPVPVKLGPIEGQLQVVQGPLKAGDKVIVGGTEKAAPGSKVVAQLYQAPAPSPSPAAAK